MISSKWMSSFVQGILIFLAAQPQLLTADYLIRTKDYRLRISTLLTPAFAVKRGSGSENSDFAGFIPELLAEMHTRKGITVYDIVPASEIGRLQSDGNWTGLIQDVKIGNSNIGAGPVLNSQEHTTAVLLSKSWATVGLTLVLKPSSNATSLAEALAKLTNFYVVSDSDEARELQKISRQQGTSDVTKLQQRVKPMGSVHDGLETVAREARSALVLNSEEARYYVTHDYCRELVAISNFQPLGEYTFAFSPGTLKLDSFNKVILEMTADGSLEELKKKTLGIKGTCSNAMFLHPGIAVTFLLAAVVSRFRF